MSEPFVCMQECGRIYEQGGTSVLSLLPATCKVEPKDRIALVGPSGSGKSTLLHLMGGIDIPTSGSVTWPALGKRETLRPEKVAYVFQMQSLLPSLTVVENVEIPLLLSELETKAARKVALDALAKLEMFELSEKLPEELSGGQAQRVAVARAIASQPDLILADEPTGQLDHSTAQHLLDVLLKSLKGTNTALVVTTHDQTVAKRMQKTWRIRGGVLEVNS